MTGKLLGVVPPILTPTDSQDRVDEPALRALIRRLTEAGVHGLFLAGSAGEGPLLADREWLRLMEIAWDENAGRVPLLAGVMETSTRRVTEKVAQVRKLGFRYYVVTPTFYIPTRAASEHVRLYGACRDVAGDMELIAYNIPQLTQSSLAVETVCDLARRGWIRYCKESSGDLPYLRRLITEGRDVGLTVLMGDERNCADGLRAGAAGLVNLCANIEPRTYIQIYEASLRHDEAALDSLQKRINRIVDEVVLTGPCFVAGPKYWLSRQGIGQGTPVSPLEPVNASQASKIDAILAESAGAGPG